jgi:molybdenum cofactor guanylyltransferase
VDERRAKLSVAVLAGGRSRRMGTDKRWAAFDGVPLIRRAVELAGELSNDVMVVTPEDRPIPNDLLDGLDWRLVHDTRPGLGPLAGLEAALVAAASTDVIAIPTDMPRLTTALLALLAERLGRCDAGCVALVDGGELQPFPIGLRRAVVEVVTDLLDRHARSMRSLLVATAACQVAEDDWRRLDPEGHALANINTLADLGAG